MFSFSIFVVVVVNLFHAVYSVKLLVSCNI